MKEWIKKFKKRQKTRPKRSKLDLDSFEDDLVYILKLIFIGKEVSEKDLTKKLRLRDKEKFELLDDFILTRMYVSWNKGIYTINKRGIDYILEAEKTKKEEKSANVIKWATIVLAISAFVQIVDIWINKPLTKEAIGLLILNSVGGALSLIQDLIPFAIIIFVLWLIFKIYKKIKEKKTP